MNVPIPSTRQTIRSTTTWGLARRNSRTSRTNRMLSRHRPAESRAGARSLRAVFPPRSPQRPPVIHGARVGTLDRCRRTTTATTTASSAKIRPQSRSSRAERPVRAGTPGMRAQASRQNPRNPSRILQRVYLRRRTSCGLRASAESRDRRAESQKGAPAARAAVAAEKRSSDHPTPDHPTPHHPTPHHPTPHHLMPGDL
jgi:hypothetical protein